MRTLFALLLLTAWPAAEAQPAPDPGFGIGASLQGGQFDLLLPVWIGSSAALVPSIGLEHASDIGTDVRLGLAARLYRGEESVRPYGVARAGALVFLPPEGDGATDFLAGIGAGIEAFLLPKLSVTAEAQLNVGFPSETSGRFGTAGGTVVSTGTAATLTVYF